MSSRTSSRNSGARVNRAIDGGGGDMPVTGKSSARGEFAQGKNTSFSSSLEVLEPGDKDDASSRCSSRISLGSRSRSNLGQVPLRSDSPLSQRVPTPSKHVSLTAVRRKQEVDTPIEPELDWREFTRSISKLNLGARSYSNTFHLTETAEDDDSVHDTGEADMTEAQACAMPSHSSSAASVTTQMEAMALKKSGQQRSKEGKESSDDDDDDSDDDDSDEEPRKAPNELLMEFLDCVMKKDFKNAEKLCRMILIYEPTNKEALTFHPIILDKLQLEKEAAEAGEDASGDDDDDDEDDEEDDSEEDSSLENDSSDDDDDDDDDDEEVSMENYDNIIPEGVEPPRPDSGIGM